MVSPNFLGACLDQAIMDSPLSLLNFLVDQPWTILVIGALSAGLAFLVGRRWFLPAPVRPAAPPPDPGEGAVGLSTAVLKKSAADRRTAPRRKGNRIEVYLSDDAKRPPLLGWVVDRSMGGLCLVVDKPLPQGSVFNVRPRKAPQTAPWVAIEVRSCRADDGEWEIGCKFVQTPQWNDLLLFG